MGEVILLHEIKRDGNLLKNYVSYLVTTLTIVFRFSDDFETVATKEELETGIYTDEDFQRFLLHTKDPTNSFEQCLVRYRTTPHLASGLLNKMGIVSQEQSVSTIL